MKGVIAALLSGFLIGASFAQDIGWPREKTNAGGTLIYYEPQLDDWKDYRQLEARMAVSIKPKTGQPTVGVIYLRARTDANLETRNVAISHLEIVSTKFPSLDEAGAASMDQLVRTFLPPNATMDISLDRLLAQVEENKQETAQGAAVKNDPPKIFAAYGSAILLLLDGEPALVPIEKTSMEFVVNTNWALFFDKSDSKYYLLDEKRWLTAAALEGPWTATTKLPKDMSKIPDQPNWSDVKKAIPPSAATGPVPKVFYSNSPAEIISFKGQPTYAKIPNTQLSYATNTESDVFLHSGENQYYYLVTGRWFRAKSLEGPWTFATAELPADFARIPASSPRARVLVSVPGTDEAIDAVLLAQIPTTVIVDRAKAEAEVKVAYDAKPEFKPIESTTLSYASNTQDIAKELIVHDAADIQRIYLWLGTSIMGVKPPIKELMDPQIAGTVWKENNKAADDANEPGKFTAFCAYEWTSNPDFRNLHRNVFFKDCKNVPQMPFSSLDSTHPEDLWKWMDAQRKAGNELLAISHNANLSDGHMYPIDVDSFGRPIDAAWAESRDRNERLVEIKQIKGQSETHPALSPNDEFANYEVLSYLLGEPQGRFDHIVGSFARQALKDGLTMQDTQGYNPYKFGIVGGSDSHNTATPYRQDNFFGGHAHLDGTIETRMAGHIFAGLDTRLENPAGVSGVWAEENTRASIFEAMQRKETFAASGPHIKLRFFGGWEYRPEELNDKDWVKAGYKKGVPMGGDLPKGTGSAPTFIVWAVKDPTSGNLDRIQIVKGWTKSGQSFEKIYDVVWAGDRKPDVATGKVPAIGSTVDLANATYTNTIGSTELKTVWKDPEFDASLHAFYYARALEIPTPRWTTIQAHQLGVPIPDVVSATVQERAWSSPIWYTPSEEDRKKAKPGMSVADVKKNGGVALTDDQLKALLVEKFVWVQNNVTGGRFKQYFTKDGQTIVYNVGRNAVLPSEVGNVVQSGYLGMSSAYTIQNGKLTTWLQQTPFEVTVYKVGDKYYGARSNEFGYANYEMIPPVINLVDHGKGKPSTESDVHKDVN